MAQSDSLTRSPLIAGRDTAKNPGMSRPVAAPQAARAEAAVIKILGYGIALIVLACAAVAYPLSASGGFLAKSWGDVIAVDPSAQTLTLQENGATVTVPVRNSTPVYVNGRAVTLETLQVGDRVRVKYDSVLKLSVLEVLVVGRFSQ
jgi:hypothetical protein